MFLSIIIIIFNLWVLLGKFVNFHRIDIVFVCDSTIDEHTIFSSIYFRIQCHLHLGLFYRINSQFHCTSPFRNSISDSGMSGFKRNMLYRKLESPWVLRNQGCFIIWCFIPEQIFNWLRVPFPRKYQRGNKDVVSI